MDGYDDHDNAKLNYTYFSKKKRKNGRRGKSEWVSVVFYYPLILCTSMALGAVHFLTLRTTE